MSQRDVSDRPAPEQRPRCSRRRLLRGMLATGGGLALASAVTGLPRSFLLGRGVAQADATPTYLVLSSGQAGHPLNANILGTYPGRPGDGGDPRSLVDHPTVAELGAEPFGEIAGTPYGAADFETPSDVTFGDTTMKAAGVWNALPAELRRRSLVLHHPTMANAHPEFGNVLEFHGAIRGVEGARREMFASMVAQENAAALGTVLRQPINVGSNILSFIGQPLGRFDPTDLQNLFATDGEPAAVADARALSRLRDRLIDDLYRDVSESGSHAQRAFLDRYAVSRAQAAALGDDLGPLLTEVVSDAPADQARAAVALLRLNVTPVVVMQLELGGDNHQDGDLVEEVTETIDAVGAIRELWMQLEAAGLQDRVTFGYLDVFGRTLTRSDVGGRDHNRDHHAMLMFGPHVQGGVLGELEPVYRGSGELRDLRAVMPSGIAFDDGLAAAGKTLAAACGVPRARIDERVAGGQVIEEALAPA